MDPSHVASTSWEGMHLPQPSDKNQPAITYIQWDGECYSLCLVLLLLCLGENVVGWSMYTFVTSPSHASQIRLLAPVTGDNVGRM